MSGWLNAGVGLGNVNIQGNIIIAGDDIVNGKINLNGNYITTVSNNLYFNGNLVTGAGNVQNVGDWANFPAVANINMNNFSINNLSNINGQPYPPTANVSTWSNYKAVSNVDIANNYISNVNILRSEGVSANVITCPIIGNVTSINSVLFPQILGQVILSSAQPIYVSNQDVNKIWCFTSGTAVDFIELEHLNAGWTAYVKNCQPFGGGNDIEVFYNNNPIPSPDGTNVIHQRTNTNNTSMNILYSTGSGLILL